MKEVASTVTSQRSLGRGRQVEPESTRGRSGIVKELAITCFCDPCRFRR